MTSARKSALVFLFGGLLPIIAFTVIEEYYGTVWGVAAGMVFSVGDIVWEWSQTKRVSMITWSVSLLILVLGAISLYAQDGIWFKLQPALMEAAFALLLWGSLLIGKPFLLAALEKQNRDLPPQLKAAMPGLTLRIGFFFAFHAILATWAAFSWSTTAWALLKGLGFTLSFFLYMAVEVIWLRSKARRPA